MRTNTRRSKRQKRIRMIIGRLFILTGIYAIMAAIISLSILFYFNNVYLSKMGSLAAASAMRESVNNTPGSEQPVKTGITYSGEKISFSYDSKYCMYIFNGEIYIKDIQTGAIKHKISEAIPIPNAVLMDNRNIIIYFTISNGGMIKVKTYNIDNNETAVQKSFMVDSGSKIKQAGYSSLSGYIFINVESKSNGVSDKVYYITLMKKVRKLTTEKIVNNMVLLNNALSLYYQDNNGTLFCNAKKILAFRGNRIRLLGCDSKDNIYVQSLLNLNTIYVLSNTKIINTLHLKSSNYIKILNNREAIFAVYRGYVVNLTDDINKKITFDSKFSFLNIVNNSMYLRDINDRVIWNNI